MNDNIDRNFHTIYIDKIPIEEQLKGHVYGAWHFMDKADIREWLANDEVKIYNLQSKIDNAIKYIEEHILDNKIRNVDWEYDDCYYSDMPAERIKPLIDILKEDK